MNSEAINSSMSNASLSLLMALNRCCGRSSSFITFCSTFIIPSICLFGILMSCLNITIFLDPKLKDTTYKYLLVNSFSNFFYLFNCFFYFVPNCSFYCSFSNTYAAQFYYYLFYNYLKGIAAVLCVLIQLIVSIQRYYLITNIKKKWIISINKWFKTTIFFGHFFSFILFTYFNNPGN